MDKVHLKVGHRVGYTFYGVKEEAVIIRLSRDGAIVFLDNGRWMHAHSVKIVEGSHA